MLRSLLVAALLAATTPAAAQDAYPSHTIQLVVPFGAGSGTDAMARELAQALSNELGQPVVVDNRPGANGMIAAELAAKAPNNGYTLLMAGNTTHSANPYLFKTLRYDPIKDFTPIARLATAPFVLAVDGKGSLKTLPELIARAKAEPGKLSYGAPSSAATVSGETLKQMANINLIEVRYRQTPQAMTDVLGGAINMAFLDLAACLSNLKSGNLRALVTTGAKRTPLLPDVPTMQESGYAGVDIIAWVGVFAPANVPPAITAKLDGAVAKVMASERIQSRLTGMGLDPAYAPAQETSAFIKSELLRWGEMIKKAGIEPQ